MERQEHRCEDCQEWKPGSLYWSDQEKRFVWICDKCAEEQEVLSDG